MSKLQMDVIARYKSTEPIQCQNIHQFRVMTPQQKLCGGARAWRQACARIVM